MKIRGLVLCTAFLMVSGARAQHVTKAPPPAFVQAVPMPEASGTSKYEVESGVYTALWDIQYDARTQTEFIHYGYEVLTNKGAEEMSQLSVVLDTSYQRLVFHSLFIYRDGQTIDRTAELSFELLRHEAELHNNMYTGMVNVHEILKDVRKGDRLEFSYSLLGENPIYNGHVDWSSYVSAPSTIGLLKVRAILPNDRPYVVECNRCEQHAFDDRVVNNDRIVTVSASKVPQWPRELPIAHHVRPFSSVLIADFTDWASVNRWAMEVLTVTPPDSLRATAAQITKSSNSQKKNIEALIDFVQDDIRYMSILNGLGSHRPRPATKTLDQRYGDCKDKSVLLAGLLRAIGVNDAYPALVSAGTSDLLNHVRPSIHRFNHCIVNFTFEGRQYWIDPVIAEQGGSLDSICIPDYRLALVVRPGTDSLTAVPVNHLLSRTELEETLVFPDYTSEGVYKVVLRNHGLMADMARTSIENVGASDMAEIIRKRISIAFPDISKAMDMAIVDDPRTNILTMKFFYPIASPWERYEESNTGGYVMRYEPMIMYDVLNHMDCAQRQYPMAFSHSSRFSQVTYFELPRKTSIPVAELFINNEVFSFSKTMSNAEETVKLLRFSYQSKTDEVSLQSHQKVCSEMNDAVNSCVTLIIAPDDYKYKPVMSGSMLSPDLFPRGKLNRR